ncbi:MAG: hypothetical protein IJC08_06995 [Bacteroidaceae bacterium]|nr:hypothetical protein [Bacteroidaceae bacterium]
MKSAREIRLFRMVRIVCAIVFALFAFTYLSVHQAPLLEVVYDMTATGKLQYDANITAAVITAVLLLATLWINKFAKFNREWEALSYLPASIALAFLTDIDRSIYVDGESSARWIWIGATIIFIYIFSSWVLRRVLFMRIKDITRATNRIMWRNFLLFTIIFSITGFLTNNDEDFKHECILYHYIKKGDFDKAKKVAARSLTASPELTAGRAYTLANKSEMGELLFTYPQYYGADGLLPGKKQTSPIAASTIYEYLKAAPMQGENTIDFLARAAQTDTAATAAKEYYLAALLLDKRLEEFADTLPGFYNTSDTAALPHHYKEALLLNAKKNNTPLPFNDKELEAEYDRFTQLENEYTTPHVRRNYARKLFGKTYWWYYIYSEEKR